MTALEKQNIIDLKNSGFNKTQISERLNIPLNTIKSYLQRNKKKEEIIVTDDEHCLFCGKVLHHLPHKKHKRFCSDKCRYDYWNKKKNKASLMVDNNG